MKDRQVHCIKCVVRFHDTKRRPKGLLFRITDVEQDTGLEAERRTADRRQAIRVSPVSSARNEKEYESTPFLFQRQQQYGTIQLSSK